MRVKNWTFIFLSTLLFWWSVCHADSIRPAPITDTTKIASSNGEGILFMIGGNTVEEVASKFMDLAGGMSTEFVMIPTANSSIDKGEDVPGDYSNGAFDRIDVPPSQYTILHSWDQNEVNSQDFLQLISDNTAVYFGGGSQGKLADAYYGTGVQHELIKMLERGGVIGGTSAGASIQSDIMIGGGSEDFGLGFLENSIIDQHIDARDREHRVVDVDGGIRDANHLLGIGVSEATAAMVKGPLTEVFGQSYVYFWDYQNGNNRVYVLTEGDRFNHETRELVLSGWPSLNFTDDDIINYDNGNTVSNGFSAYTQNQDQFLLITGNQRLAVPIDYNVTEETVLEFEFSSDEQGGYHAIGLDDDLSVTAEGQFHLYGSDPSTTAILNYQDYFAGNSDLPASRTTYRLPLGEHYHEAGLLGPVNYLYFINDGGSAHSLYRNIRMYERDMPANLQESNMASKHLLSYSMPYPSLVNINYKVFKRGPVMINVYDVKGCLIKNLFDGNKSPGSYTVAWKRNGETSGTNVIRLKSKGLDQSLKIAVFSGR